MEEEKVLYQIKSLEKLIAREFFKSDNVKRDFEIFKLTPTQAQIIEYILEYREQDIYQKDLEKILNLRRATVSGVLKTMEKNHLINRSICQNDTRQKKIELSEIAGDIFSKNFNKICELEKVVKKDIKKEELKIFLSVLNKMKENIEKYNLALK